MGKSDRSWLGWDIRGKSWKDKRRCWESGMLDIELMGELLSLVMRQLAGLGASSDHWRR